MCNLAAKVGATWFAEKERMIAIVIAVAAQAIGAAIGFILPSIFILPEDEGEVFRKHLFNSLLAQAIFSGIVTLGCLIIIKERPAKPPSPTAFHP